MSAVVIILLFPVSFLLGQAALEIFYGAGKRDSLSWEDALLNGWILLIGLAEVAHLKEVTGGRSVSASAKWYLILVSAAALVCAFLLLSARLRAKGKGARVKNTASAALGKWEAPALLCLGALIAWQSYRILCKDAVYLDFDMTLETVTGFLNSDRIYEANPMTGFPYREGIPTRLKILCLPTFYAVLCKLSGVGAERMVWHVIPFCVLVLTYIAYSSLAKSLFPENRLHREVFLLLAALLFFAGDYLYGMEGFGLLHGGFQGVSIRSAVLLPYLFGVCIRKKWRLALGPVLAEVCLVWTLYGLGMCLPVFLILAAPDAVRTFRGRRKEGARC